MSNNHGIKVGSNINTDTDVQLKFTTKYGSLKVYRWGTTTIDLSSGNATVTIPHDLSYAPAFLAFRKGTASYSFMDGTSHSNSWFPIGGPNRWSGEDEAAGIFAYSDSSNFYIRGIGLTKYGTVTIRYYILVDKAQEFSSASNISLTGDRGFKVAKAGKNVLTGEEYDMAFSSKYKSLQYYSESIKQETLTLPLMFSSYNDQDVEEGAYVDINHGLGYAPMFLAWFKTSTILKEIPYAEFYNISSGGVGETVTGLEVASFCDATKVRISFWRRSKFDYDDFTYGAYYNAQTITVRVLPFAENLAGLNYGE